MVSKPKPKSNNKKSSNSKINKVDGTKSLLRIKATDKENKLHEEYLSSISNNEN